MNQGLTGQPVDAKSPGNADLSGAVFAVCTSEKKGIQKTAVNEVHLMRGHGVEGDAHAGPWHRQVSLLEEEQVRLMREKGLELDAGAFGENIVTKGIDLGSLEIGQHLQVGEDVVLQITQRGKTCHSRCAIYYQAGDCIMPRHGIFARTRRGGTVKAGDTIRVNPDLDMMRYAIVTVNDEKATEEDTATGQLLCHALDLAPDTKLVTHSTLPNQGDAVERELARLCDTELCDLVVTTGSNQLPPITATPESTAATLNSGEAAAPSEVGQIHTSSAMLSRAICGQRGSTIVVNLSGNPHSACEQLEVLLPVLRKAIEVKDNMLSETKGV